MYHLRIGVAWRGIVKAVVRFACVLSLMDMHVCACFQLGYKPPDSCVYFVSCFDSVTNIITTDRWTYILIQGMLRLVLPTCWCLHCVSVACLT